MYIGNNKFSYDDVRIALYGSGFNRAEFIKRISELGKVPEDDRSVVELVERIESKGLPLVFKVTENREKKLIVANSDYEMLVKHRFLQNIRDDDINDWKIYIPVTAGFNEDAQYINICNAVIEDSYGQEFYVDIEKIDIPLSGRISCLRYKDIPEIFDFIDRTAENTVTDVVRNTPLASVADMNLALLYSVFEQISYLENFFENNNIRTECDYSENKIKLELHENKVLPDVNTEIIFNPFSGSPFYEMVSALHEAASEVKRSENKAEMITDMCDRLVLLQDSPDKERFDITYRLSDRTIDRDKYKDIFSKEIEHREKQRTNNTSVQRNF